MLEDAIIRWTARIAVACYVGRLYWDVTDKRDAVSQKRARLLWTVGCMIFLLHAAAAFHFLYGWSHDVAYEHVRKRTFDQVGLDSGFGIYVNYAFTLLWLFDTLLWWRNLSWPENRIGYWGVQGTFAFLMFQATVVFGPTFWIPILVATIFGLVALRLRCSQRRTFVSIT